MVMLPLFSIGSVYCAGWLSCPDEWKNDALAEDFGTFKEVRDIVMKSLQHARLDNLIGSSLEAEVYIQTHNKEIQSLINNHFSIQSQSSYSLADYFIVSKAHVTENELPSAVSYKETINICRQGYSGPLTVGVVRASGRKCERCWQYLVPQQDALCHRCSSVVNNWQ